MDWLELVGGGVPELLKFVAFVVVVCAVYAEVGKDLFLTAFYTDLGVTEYQKVVVIGYGLGTGLEESVYALVGERKQQAFVFGNHFGVEGSF